MLVSKEPPLLLPLNRSPFLLVPHLYACVCFLLQTGSRLCSDVTVKHVHKEPFFTIATTFLRLPVRFLSF